MEDRSQSSLEAHLGNYEIALAAERKRVVRGFYRYSSEMRADRAASFRLGHRQRAAVGEFYYTHPDRPGVCFGTRSAAARAALSKGSAAAGPHPSSPSTGL